MATTTLSERCYKECTRDVIFLFQRRILEIISFPDGYDYDGESCVRSDDFEEDCDTDYGDELTAEQLSKIQNGPWDVPCAIERWETERVFLSREEGEDWGEKHAYNYRDGWRVYGVPSEGELSELLKTADSLFPVTTEGSTHEHGSQAT